MRYIALALPSPSSPPASERRADPRGVDRDETLLTVTASGRADTRPDEARLQLGVQSDAASAGEASRLNREKMDAVTAALAQLGVKPDDLQTRNLSLQRIDYGSRARPVPRLQYGRGYAARHGQGRRGGDRGHRSRRQRPVGARPAGLGPRGGEPLGLCRGLSGGARRAEAYAGAADLKIGRVLAIYDGGELQRADALYRRWSAWTWPRKMRRPRLAMPPPAPFSPGMNTTEVRVRVDFALRSDQAKAADLRSS